jgi:Holliday junction resolvase RusA-like endonuclease
MEQHIEIFIEGKPAPRPRFNRKSGAYNPPEYTKYLSELKELLEQFQSEQIQQSDWNELEVKFYFSYPKTTPKKQRRVLEYHRHSFDCDNLVKPIMDAMQELGWIKNDSQISKLHVVKMRGEMTDSKIQISLFE